MNTAVETLGIQNVFVFGIQGNNAGFATGNGLPPADLADSGTIVRWPHPAAVVLDGSVDVEGLIRVQSHGKELGQRQLSYGDLPVLAPVVGDSQSADWRSALEARSEERVEPLAQPRSLAELREVPLRRRSEK